MAAEHPVLAAWLQGFVCAGLNWSRWTNSWSALLPQRQFCSPRQTPAPLHSNCHRHAGAWLLRKDTQRQPFTSNVQATRRSAEFAIMSDKPTPEEMATWQRRLASQANNRAWALSESSARSPEEDEEMLQAAHAAMYLWKMVGTPSNRAHAAQLLAHVYALLKLPNPANHYLEKSHPFFMQGDCAPWETALAHAVAANVAAASGQHEEHGAHFKTAQQLSAGLPTEEDRQILEATLRVIPAPRP